MTTSVSVVREAETFLKSVVAFPTVPAGNESERLLRALDRLRTELDSPRTGEIGGDASLRANAGMAGVLSPEDERLVTSLRRGLARIAAAAGAAKHPASEAAVCAALDGAEMVIRGELVSGKSAMLAPLMPSFVFLVTLPILDQDEALDLSRRTSELIDGRA